MLFQDLEDVFLFQLLAPTSLQKWQQPASDEREKNKNFTLIGSDLDLPQGQDGEDVGLLPGMLATVFGLKSLVEHHCRIKTTQLLAQAMAIEQ